MKKTKDENITLTIIVTDLTTKLGDTEKERDVLKNERDDLTAKLKEATDRIAAPEKERDGLAVQVATLTKELDEANVKIAALEKERDGLAEQVRILTAANSALAAQLAEALAKITDLEKQIADLKCNVNRLREQRSAFFASLSTALGKDSGVKIVGDRFVIPSGVLFSVGSAAVSKEGSIEIDKVARVVHDLEGKIPKSVSWVLQVDGHTDIQRILPGGEFKDNWELSTARALSVVKLLRDQKLDTVSPEHLAAAGFGEYHPIDPAKTQAAYEKNRRIELKLTDDGPGNANSSADGKECTTPVAMN